LGASAKPATPYDAQIMVRHLVDVGGGRRLNVECVGKGAPVVVFMQGGEGSILNWQKVEKPIAAATRVCFYDRAGFGYSDPPAEPVTALSETDDLHVLLRRDHIPTPVILVGHSIGGFYATMYTDRFPADVAGLVLVDPGFAGQTLGRTPAQRNIEMANSHRGEEHLLDCASLAKHGQMALDNTCGCIGFPAPNSRAETAYLSYMVSHPFWYEAEVSQSRNFFFGDNGEPSLDTVQEHSAQSSFGHLPVIVMSSDRTPRDAWEDDVTYQKLVGLWRAGHDQLAARSTRGKSVVVPNSGHFIQWDRPDVVIASIEEVIEDVRAADGRTSSRRLAPNVRIR
jgi:pimeloyl-ACP methyl ester carboxylesterase